MKELEEEIAKGLLSIGAIFLRPEEPFTWASGIKSPIYCDNRLTLTAPEVRIKVEEGLAEVIKENYPDVEVLMGTSTAGIAHAAITGHLMNLPMGYVRSGAKDHGRNNQIEGKLEPGQKVVVVEDLISTAGSVLEVVDALKEEDTYDNRVEVMANLKVLKEMIESNPGLKDLNANNVIKNAAGENINSGNGANSSVQNSCVKFLSKIKGFKEIQNNPELFKLFNGLQNQIKNIKAAANENSEQSSDSLTKVKNYEDKDIQTEKLEEEYDKVAKKYEREKRVLQSQIDDKSNEIIDLNNELERLEQENKNLKSKIPFDEKKAFELNVLLESNLKDLRKKLEQSQVERLTLEDQNNTYVKSMKDKNILIASLEKQIVEMKANFIQGSINQTTAGNIIKKISGGIK